MTTSTSGKSSPRAATSVQRSNEGEVGRDAWLVKAERVVERAEVGRCP